jgi:hypothetical protein
MIGLARVPPVEQVIDQDAPRLLNVLYSFNDLSVTKD